ncbi:phosphoethanolamine transferase [Aliarcobacter trophiarum]|uniref:phosphoethanolamine transferase n=1 Tax=Aliarcobacter trophiarum TaxID=708186 RepID=UPI00100C34CC|nr:phosphoethanolamine transferase [Aliarcobacter trophiarum]RXI28671.1 hypothetical protein CRU89_01570 [Aliarcobacter trophiarum]
MKTFFSKFKNNIFLALILTIIFISIEQFYRVYNDILIFNLTFKSFIEQFIIHLLVISIINKRAIFVIYFIFSLFIWFQLVHFSYYGTWIFPLEYILFFIEFQEVFLTFKSVLSITIFPTILFFIILLLSIFFIKKFNNNRYKVKYLSIFLIIAVLFLPLRIYLKDDYKKNSNPNFEYYILKNTILTLSNLFGNVLPKKISGRSGLEQEITKTPNKIFENPDINIVIIMGESLQRDYMSLYDYPLNTTPFLKSLRDDKNFIYKNGIGSGVLTTIAIPSFFNMIKKPDGLPQILSTNSCLFKMAKQNGFNTYFYSSQATSELKSIKNYLCTKYLDRLEDGSFISDKIDDSILDETLVDRLNDIDLSHPSFITLHQRASHTPFLEYIPKDYRPFNKENTNNLEQNTIDYINSVSYTDSVLEKIISTLKQKTSKPTYVIFTSDHATNIGDNARQGHGMLDSNSIYKVPFFIYSINSTNDLKNSFGDFSYISHYQISNILAKLLGYSSAYEIFNLKEDMFVCGNDLSGLGGFRTISFNEDNKIVENSNKGK